MRSISAALSLVSALIISDVSVVCAAPELPATSGPISVLIRHEGSKCVAENRNSSSKMGYSVNVTAAKEGKTGMGSIVTYQAVLEPGKKEDHPIGCAPDDKFKISINALELRHETKAADPSLQPPGPPSQVQPKPAALKN